MAAASRLRLPGIRVLLAVAGVLLLAPLALVAHNELRVTRERVEAARATTASADDLDHLIRLALALGAERTSSGGEIATSGMPPELRAAVTEIVGIDLERAVATARAEVDALLDAEPDDELGADLTRLRVGVDDGSVSTFEADRRFAELIDAVSDRVDAEISELFVVAADAGRSGRVVADARVAHEATAATIQQAELPTLWLGVGPTTTTGAELDVVMRLADALSRYDQTAQTLLELIEPGSETARRWAELDDGGDLTSLLERFHAAVDDAVAGADAGPPQPGPAPVDPADDPARDQAQLFAGLAEIGQVLAAGDAVTGAFVGLTQAALRDVVDGAERIEADAVAEQQRVYIVVGMAALAFLLGGALLHRTVGRPLTRMAQVARSVRDGNLDQHAPVAGPTEIRVATGALNEAIDSVKLVEQQALALAEERLDDPILGTDIPGSLGASLRAAVRRLTASISEREAFRRQLTHEASHDGLTRLPNRNSIMAHIGASLARTRRSSSKMALLFIDIDGFKTCNDRHGHHVGDHVLRVTAHRIVEAIREGDMAGRLGGDEFVVVAESIDDIDDTVRLSRRIIESVGTEIEVDGATIRPTVGIGIAFSDGDDLSADELLRDADLAVYRAKDRGTGRIEVCDEELREQVVERATIETAIAHALANGEFALHYQPTVDSRTREVTSLEALLRWHRPGYGLVMPDDFIGVAERSDLIIAIDRWVMHGVVAQMAEWHDHEVLGRMAVAVNVSARHLASGQLVDDVVDALARHPDVRPARLILELTETALMHDLDRAARDLKGLQERGVRIALDDFGTGYMSLATLRRLPVDILKIDRSFVAAMQSELDHTLVKMIVNTGHLLGAKVTAEGVETWEQSRLLADLGSDYLQGYLFSHPVDPTTLSRQIAATPAVERF